ncbi:FAD-dependent monooxygenase [Microbacterium betulae]|uniref:FAD-dependent monooxygenase n=1 Tax=Microbacterium betulae TaxID=2981139 RepID=A0AA97I7J0_9MICO|nr:FAD-dependent monooxygenase [Microbacterium sp. AB]WOF23490.1 FAD-dependent monooxygenase [Microbacterium sp. AB]
MVIATPSHHEHASDVVRFPLETPPDSVDVLVVGAGPAGLAAALELRQFGLRVAVVDRAVDAPLIRAGAMGHTSRVAELFRRWGVLHDIRQSWTVPPEWHTGHELVTSLTGHRLRGSRPRSFAGVAIGSPSAEEAIRRPQTVLQAAFLRKLAQLGVPVSGGWAWEGFAESGDDAVSTVRHVGSGESRPIRSRYIVAADGSKSTVRRAAGIEREGAYATHRQIRFVVRVHGDYPPAIGPFPSATNIVANQHYSGFLAALNERDWRVYAGPYGVDALPGTAELEAIAKHAFGAELDLEVVAVHPFYPSKRIATGFRRRRVLLVGDAAHVRAPGGNLGEGLGDVANLGWKLAAVVKGIADDALLDSYDQERRPHNHRIGDHASARAAGSASNLAAARELGFPDDADATPAASRRRLQIAQILRRGAGPAPGVVFDERYDRSDAIWYEPDQHASEEPWSPHVYRDVSLPGHRAPDGVIDPFGTRLYDRITTRPLLLVSDPSAGSEVQGFIDAAAGRDLPLDVVYLFDDAARELYTEPLTLIRPDHHVAWHGLDDAPGAVLDTLLGTHRRRHAHAARAGAASSIEGDPQVAV